MKVVHSFADKYDFLWKELAYSQFLSKLLAEKNYKNITLYSTPKIASQTEEIGLNYSNYNTNCVTVSDSKTWSLPKLRAFEDLKESFLHIDNDTFLFKRIHFKDKYKFSHLDTEFRKVKTKLNSGLDSIIHSLYSPVKDVDYVHDLNNTYLRLFFKLLFELPNEVLRNFNLASIPNMNICYVNDAETFKKVTKMALNHYSANKKIIDEEVYGPCYVEQLFIHQALRGIDPDYKTLSDSNKHVIYKNTPFTNPDSFNNTPIFSDMTLPFRGNLISICEKCSSFHKSQLVLEDIDDIVSFLDYEFEGFIHSTYMKWYDIFQAWTIHQLRKHIGDEGIIKVHKSFIKPYKSFGLPSKSSGELFYERLTNFSFD